MTWLQAEDDSTQQAIVDAIGREVLIVIKEDDVSTSDLTTDIEQDLMN